METTNNVQKTENKKFKKVLGKVLTGALSFTLISYTLSAQDYLKLLPEDNACPKITILMADDESAAILASANTSFFVHSSEKAISMPICEDETAQEKSLEIESWMTDSKYFGQTARYSEEMDERTVLENWMTDERNFSASAVSLSNDTEEDMKIENWMTDLQLWKN